MVFSACRTVSHFRSFQKYPDVIVQKRSTTVVIPRRNEIASRATVVAGRSARRSTVIHRPRRRGRYNRPDDDDDDDDDRMTTTPWSVSKVARSFPTDARPQTDGCVSAVASAVHRSGQVDRHLSLSSSINQYSLPVRWRHTLVMACCRGIPFSNCWMHCSFGERKKSDYQELDLTLIRQQNVRVYWRMSIMYWGSELVTGSDYDYSRCEKLRRHIEVVEILGTNRDRFS